MAPAGGEGLSAARARFAGPVGTRGLIANGKTSAIASFAALGGFVYGYNQGMFGQILTMDSFTRHMEPWYSAGGSNGTTRGLLTAILELGAWIGVLANGILADVVGRRVTVVIACVIFTVGVIVQALLKSYAYILAGRFVTGIGVGAFSMLVPLYNAELAPPEVRGALVALQQLAITFGIMVSYFIGYGTNFLGGYGEPSELRDISWLIPICIQLVPSTILAVGMMAFMPQSPRHLMNQGREEETLDVLARLRSTSRDDIRVRIEFLEIKALREFEKQRSIELFPHLQDGSFKSNFLIGWNDYKSLFTNRSIFKRTMVAVLTMVFQQWNGINAILYYAPFIFQGVGLSAGDGADNTVSLLATGVVGIVMFLATIPAVLYVDRFGRKTILIVGGIGMAVSHFIVAGITATYGADWEAAAAAQDGSSPHQGAGWAAVVFIWLYASHFGYSWGPVAWIIISEVFPLGLRAKGVSLGGSSNWLNNFAVAMSTSDFIETSQFGAFIFFGVVTVIGVCWVFFLVPETKGRTLEEMDEIFGSGEARFAAEDAARKDRIERDIGLTALLHGDQAGGGSSGDDKFGGAGLESGEFVEKR